MYQEKGPDVMLPNSYAYDAEAHYLRTRIASLTQELAEKEGSLECSRRAYEELQDHDAKEIDVVCEEYEKQTRIMKARYEDTIQNLHTERESMRLQYIRDAKTIAALRKGEHNGRPRPPAYPHRRKKKIVIRPRHRRRDALRLHPLLACCLIAIVVIVSIPSALYCCSRFAPSPSYCSPGVPPDRRVDPAFAPPNILWRAAERLGEFVRLR